MDMLFMQSTTKTVWNQMRGRKTGGGSAIANQLKQERKQDVEVVEKVV